MSNAANPVYHILLLTGLCGCGYAVGLVHHIRELRSVEDPIPVVTSHPVDTFGGDGAWSNSFEMAIK